MYGSEKKKSMGATRWGVPSSTMKTPTRPRFTIGGTQINSSSKNDFNSGQPRFSIGGAVPASARRHSVFRSLTSNIKDTRPLTSKEYQCDMVRTIYEFLLEHDGENCLPERVIRSPTKQDFISMFESIYQHVNPDFQLKNVNEEVPAIFRELGYPTAIKPSTMQTIGAAHTWPTLLGALTWLIDNIKVCNQLQGKVGQELLLGGDDSNGTLKAYKYSWMNTVFKEYIQNRKDFMESDEAFDVNIERLRQWYEQQEDFDTQKQTIEANLEQIAEECKELEADKGNVDRLQQDIARLDDDIAKAQEYKEKTDQDEKLLAETLDAVNVELATVRGQEKECRAKLAEVESAIKAQEETNGLCGTEARALIAEVDQNKLTLRKLKAELENLCKQHWMAVPKTKSALAEQQGRHHKLVVDIRSLYPSAYSEDTVIIDENPSDARALHLAVLKDCKSLLEDVEAKLLQQKWDLEQAIRKAISDAENIKQEDGVISGKLRERQRMDSRAERQRRRDRDDWEKDVIAEETELDRLENEKEILENKCHEVGSLKRDLETLRAENAEYSKVLAEKQLKISDAILSRFHAVVSDLDMMKEAREWMMRKMEEMIALGEQIPSDSLLVEGYDED